MLVPRKIERPRLKDLNSNSFDLNFNDLNGSEGLGRSKKCSDFGGALENDEIIYWKTFEVKGMGNYSACVLW